MATHKPQIRSKFVGFSLALLSFLMVVLPLPANTNQKSLVLGQGRETTSDLLDPTGKTVEVEPVTQFVARRHFKEHAVVSGVQFAWFEKSFANSFLKKTECKVGKATIRSFRQTKASLSLPLITALGDGSETMLAHLFALLKKQGKGQEGFLLTGVGDHNLFYIRDGQDDVGIGTLWEVSAAWTKEGWAVMARSIGQAAIWPRLNQVYGSTVAGSLPCGMSTDP